MQDIVITSYLNTSNNINTYLIYIVFIIIITLQGLPRGSLQKKYIYRISRLIELDNLKNKWDSRKKKGHCNPHKHWILSMLKIEVDRIAKVKHDTVLIKSLPDAHQNTWLPFLRRHRRYLHSLKVFCKKI